MLLVLAHHDDASAHAFAAVPDGAVRAMTCAQLCDLGACWHMDNTGAGAPRISWRATRSTLDDIHGVITRLTVISGKDLPHIIESDRSYVAAEMHAFMLAFLDALPCPLLNRPSPACLSGPALRFVQWQEHARALAIPVAPKLAQDDRSLAEGDSIVDVTVIGDQALGTNDARLAQWSRALAARVGATYLGLRFHGQDEAYHFVGADTFPRLEIPSIRAALLEHFNVHPIRGGVAC